jgi:hypothetical protein
MRDFSDLNINERGKHVERRPPSDEVIRAFQTQFNVRLPAEYLALLRHSNGGHPECDSIEVPGKPGAKWAVNRFYFLNEDKVSTDSLWVATEKWQKILWKDAFPFAADGGGNQFYFDLKITPASVKVCVHDQNFTRVDLATSFQTFIDKLAVDPDMI